MRLITAFELASKSPADLDALFRIASEELTRSAPGTVKRANALASLENIARARTLRLT